MTIKKLLEKYPKNNVWLISHWIEMKEESKEFQKLVAELNRYVIMG